jgi:hypothetical protein
MPVSRLTEIDNNSEERSSVSAEQEPKRGRKFAPDSKTNRQQRNNAKVLMKYWAGRKRKYSTSQRKRYRKLRRELRMAEGKNREKS